MPEKGGETIDQGPSLSVRDRIDYGLAIAGSVLTMAGGVLAHEAVFPATASADESCTTSPGGDSTVCVDNPPNSPPNDGGNQNPGNGNGNNGNGGHHGGKHHQPQDHGLSKFYDNPLRDVKHLVPWRIDEGVDYHGHGPVYAIGEGVVKLATRHSNFWANEGGNAVIYKLTEGPAKGLNVFVSENCTPKVHKHEKVHPWTVVCRMHGDDSPPGIETGWAMMHNSDKKDYPAAQPVYSEGDKTAYGVYFNRLMVKLGAPAGNSVYPHVSSTSYKVGHAPRRYRRLTKLPL